ncbi:MAG: hypothetical protein AB1679_02755 [Actinomycetota bacterium]
MAVVTGEFRKIGGPPPGIDEPVAGRIDAHRESRHGEVVATAPTASDGTFRMTLPPGSYTFVGTSPTIVGIICATTASMHPGENAPVRVLCLL